MGKKRKDPRVEAVKTYVGRAGSVEAGNNGEDLAGPPDPKYMQWARESVYSYLRWKIEGTANDVCVDGGEVKSRSGEGDPPPLSLEDVIGTTYGLTGDLDHQNYLEISELLGAFMRIHPQQEALPELLEHVFYYNRPAASFLVLVPFTRIKRTLAKLELTSHGKAAIGLFMVFVARRKMAAEKKSCES